MNAPVATPAASETPACRSCGGRTIGWGKDANGNPRRRCKACTATYAIIPPRPLGRMRLDMDKAVLCLSLLTEGSSIRSTERVSGVHRDTICRLLRVAGEKCDNLLSGLVRNVPVQDVQADELWCYVGMKQKTKERLGKANPELGDAYTFVGIERTSKLALAYHMGRRTSEDASRFMAKLDAATAGRFQLSTDGFNGYPAAVERHLGGSVDFGQLVKTYSAETVDSERRYSPARIISAEKVVVSGNPEEDRICTSHVERHNLHIRMQMRRFTRLTNAFSRRRENLQAALALHFAVYNFTWLHRSIRMTPAMKAGIARAPWKLADLLTA
jgi:IS1 family transposase/transposase-like protein